MALYTSDSRDRVRDAVDFVELVSARTELRRAGPNRYEGLCPFHEERTPSFGIDPTQKVYYCFGCQAPGDVFTFVQETEGVDFKGALELLADRCGIELEREQEDPREAERRRAARTAAGADRAHERPITSAACGRARRPALARVSAGPWTGRGDPAGVPRRVCPERVGSCAHGLAAAGSPRPSCMRPDWRSARSENGRAYDRFRSRIMFPLADTRGRVLGFGARAMREEQRPKYLNTSDNDVYHKGLHLYGADLGARARRARPARRSCARATPT